MSEYQSQPGDRTAEQPAHELEQAAAKRLEELRSTEFSPDHKSATERAEAAREVIAQPDQKTAPPPAAEHTTPPSANHFPLLTPALNYQHTLTSLRRHLKPAARVLSRVIHQPAVERVSEVAEKTVARPSVTNGALWTALIVGGTVYFTARANGYALSGSEMLFALVAGAVIGLVIEAIWRAYQRH